MPLRTRLGADRLWKLRHIAQLEVSKSQLGSIEAQAAGGRGEGGGLLLDLEKFDDEEKVEGQREDHVANREMGKVLSGASCCNLLGGY